MTKSDDTIFAVSSGGLPAAIAIVRISGPSVRIALETIAGGTPPERIATLRTLRDPQTNAVVDQAVVLWFRAPKSETGEDVAEFQIHGSRAVADVLLKVLGQLSGFRMAEPGEFSRRAFLNGKLDLTQIEGLADLVAAETDAQRRQALTQLQGRFGRRMDRLRRQLVEMRARIEAGLDFVDEEDVPGEIIAETQDGVIGVRMEIDAILAEGRRGERLRDGVQIAVMGPPNAGKSSLLNAIAKRDVAIVTSEAGTTRDILEVHLDLDGYPATLADTAGLREAEGIVEAEGIRRAVARGQAADLVLWMEDMSKSSTSDQEAGAIGADALWRIGGKADLIDSASKRSRDFDFPVSVVTGYGLGTLTEALSSFAADRCGEGAVVTRERHRAALTDCRDALLRAESGFDSGPELLAEELRIAGDALGKITGRIDVEDLLDVIFSEFCIGK